MTSEGKEEGQVGVEGGGVHGATVVKRQSKEWVEFERADSTFQSSKREPFQK